MVFGYPGNVWWLPGNGDGTLNTAVFVSSTTGTTFVTVNDFNSDGITDIAYATDSGNLAVLIGNGDGTFQTPLTQTTNNPPLLSITSADLDGDGHPDIVMGSGGLGVRVSLGSASGAPGPINIYTAGTTPYFATTR